MIALCAPDLLRDAQHAQHAADVRQLRAIASDVCRETFFLPPRGTVSDWADEHRRLPSTSAEPGRFRTDRIPYMRRIQDVLGDSVTREVVFAKSAQVAGSTVGENFVGYLMHQAPCAILEVWPTEKKLRAWSSTRLDPMIDDSLVLRALFKRSGRRDAGDSLDKKIFPNGWLMAITAKSTSDLKSSSARVAIAEEVDEWEVDVGEQGDPLELLRVRMRTFWNGKLYIVSTPTVDGFSRVWKELQASTWEEYWVPCPHCRTLQVLRWRDADGELDEAGQYNLLWEKDADGEPIPGTCTYTCVEGCAIEERWKLWMLDPANGAAWIARFPGRSTVGFHINTLYSPLCPWDEIAKTFRRAVKEPGQMKVFVNTMLGLPYGEKGRQLSAEFLKDRAEAYPEGADLPDGVGLLTASVDVQGDRLELFVWGWGKGEEGWLIAWEQLDGDPGLDGVWAELDRRLLHIWRNARGAGLRLASVAIDAGYQTEAVHRFCDARAGRNVFAVIGRAGRGRQLLIAPGAQRFKSTKRRRQGKQPRESRPTHVVGADAAKDLIAARLRLEEPGPGYLHFPDTVDPVFFDQLTAEKLVTKYQRGRPARVWELMPNRRNEALDGTGYAIAALVKLGQGVIRQLGDLADRFAAAEPDASTARPATRQRRVRSRGIEV